MSDTVTAALVGVGGAVLVAISAMITQLRLTQAVIRADRQKLSDQLVGEERSRERDRRRDRLVVAVSDLLAAADPQITPGGDYDSATRAIHKLQLLLNPDVAQERALNGSLNALGLRLQEYMGVRHLPIDSKLSETRAVLDAQSQVTDRTREVIRSWST